MVYINLNLYKNEQLDHLAILYSLTTLVLLNLPQVLPFFLPTILEKLDLDEMLCMLVQHLLDILFCYKAQVYQDNLNTYLEIISM